MTLFPGSDNWRSAMQNVAKAIEETMGEPVRVTPAVMPKPNFPAVPQHDRAVTVQAVFNAPPRDVRMGRHEGAPVISTRVVSFTFAYGALPFVPRQGYWITRLCSGEQFEITAVRNDSVSQVTCSVVQLGSDGDVGVASSRTVDL